MSKELLVTTIGKLRNRLHRILKQRYAAEADVKLTVEEFILLNMIEAHRPDSPKHSHSDR